MNLLVLSKATDPAIHTWTIEKIIRRSHSCGFIIFWMMQLQSPSWTPRFSLRSLGQTAIARRFDPLDVGRSCCALPAKEVANIADDWFLDGGLFDKGRISGEH